LLFHRLPRSLPGEQSATKTALRARLPRFLWRVATVFSLALVFGVAGIPVLAATGNPTLKVVPKNVGIPGDGINCNGPHSGAFTWICHVTVTELKSSGKPLHWFTRSDRPAKFTPANGNLSPGQSVQVTIATNFCGGFTNFYFVGPKNVATVQYQCG
jgi:hypothetical protein